MTDTETAERDIQTELAAFGACKEARIWAKGKDAATIWATCERGDWMLWWAGRCSGPVGSASRKGVALAACGCARLALPIFEKRYPKDDRPRKAIETTERYARGEATIEEVRTAYAAASAAADAASAAAARTAAAADAAAAAHAAHAASAAASAAAAYAARAPERVRVLKECADIVRKRYPVMPRKEQS